MPGKLFRATSNLEELDLSNNDLKQLDATLFKGLVNLKFLKLDENKLKKLDSGLYIGRKVFLFCRRYNKLPVDGKIFTEIFSDNKYLSILSLKRNHMMEIGSTFENLQHLGYVDLSFNKIKEVNACNINTLRFAF